MSIRPLCLLVLAPACIAQAQEESGSVRGKVLSITGEPVRRAEVWLRSASTNREVGVHSTETDRAGSFVFPSIPPGNYMVWARRVGFLPTEGARHLMRAIAVAAGQKLEGVTIELTPHSVITGKVTDEDGDPLPGTFVIVMGQKFQRGRKISVTHGTAVANDLGEYRVPGLAAGAHTVAFTGPVDMGPAPMRTRVPGQDSAQSFVPLYFPGAVDPAGATPIHVGPGQELRGIDIRMRRVPVVNVRGRLADLAGNPVVNANVLIISSENGLTSSLGRSVTNSGPDGSFLFTGIAAGNYIVQASSGAGDGRATAIAKIQTGARDVDNVLIRVQPPCSVSGSIQAEGQPDLKDTRVIFDPMDAFPIEMRSSDPVGEGGAFQLTGLTPARYRVRAFGAPEGYYTKTVLWNGEDVTYKGLTLSSSSAGIEIKLAKGAVTLRGSLIGSDDTPTNGTVVLVPAEGKREDWDLYKAALTDQKGAFTLRNIAPGEYTALGVKPGADTSLLQDPEHLKQVASKGKAIKVGDGEPDTFQVKVID